LVARGDENLAVGVRPDKYGRAKARHGDLEDGADMLAHEGQRGEQRTVACQAAQNLQTAARFGNGQGLNGVGHGGLPPQKRAGWNSTAPRPATCSPGVKRSAAK